MTREEINRLEDELANKLTKKASIQELEIAYFWAKKHELGCLNRQELLSLFAKINNEEVIL